LQQVNLNQNAWFRAGGVRFSHGRVAQFQVNKLARLVPVVKQVHL